MIKHKNKFLAIAVIFTILTGTWFLGGNNGSSEVPSAQTTAAAQTEPTEETTAPPETPPSAAIQDSAAPEITAPPPFSSDTASVIETNKTPAPIVSEISGEKAPAPAIAENTSAPPSPTQAAEQDAMPADTVPEGRPLPVEPENAPVGEGSFTVTLSVRCDTLLENDNLLKLDAEKHELVPEDGVIFAAKEVTAYEGESVFNVFRREMKAAGIHMEFMNTPIYNSAYIEGIHNLYEFDAGELSGWLYKVNAWIPNYGCARYQLTPGDAIELVYTCDLGRDIDENWQGSWQKDD
jgi:hypothetical protein